MIERAESWRGRWAGIVMGVAVVAVSTLAEASEKQPLPDEAAYEKAAGLVKEIFGAEFEQATSASKKVELAKTLIETAEDTGEDPVGRYALLRAAMDLAKDAEEVDLTMELVDRVAEFHEIDVLIAKGKLLRELAGAKSRGVNRAIGLQALQLVGEAFAVEEPTVAGAYLELAAGAAKKARDRGLIDSVKNRKVEAEALAAAMSKFKRGKAELADSPDDAEANANVGSYLCFWRGEWGRGLSHLAKGGEADLKEIAETDLGGPSGAEDQMQLGDRWWAVGDDMPGGRPSRACRARAADWYGSAMIGLTGLDKLRITKRLEGLSESTLALGRERDASAAPAVGATSMEPVAEPELPEGEDEPETAAAVVCERLQSKKSPVGLTESAIHFSAPRGDGRSGANGFLLEAGEGWERNGTGWACTFRRAGTARGVQFIHPLGVGQVVVTVHPNRLHVGSPGKWPERSYVPTYRPLPLTKANNFAEVFNLGEEPAHDLVSVLAADGRFRFYLDGQLVAAGVMPGALPLQLNSHFKGEGVPMILQPGVGGVIIGPQDQGLNVATEVKFGVLGKGKK